MKAMIDKIRVEANRYGELLEPPATDSELNEFIDKANTVFSTDIPDEYIEFLKIVNGLEFNGLIIYGTKNSETDPNSSPLDLFEMNEMFHELDNPIISNLIVVGEDSTGVLTYDKSTKEFQYRDRIALDRIESYSSFREMLEMEVDKVL